MNLDQQDIANSVKYNQEHPGRQISYSIPLPNYDNWLHIGAVVNSIKNADTDYVVVQFVGDYAIVVPVNQPVCAYSIKTSSLKPRENNETLRRTARP